MPTVNMRMLDGTTERITIPVGPWYEVTIAGYDDPADESTLYVRTILVSGVLSAAEAKRAARPTLDADCGETIDGGRVMRDAGVVAYYALKSPEAMLAVGETVG